VDQHDVEVAEGAELAASVAADGEEGEVVRVASRNRRSAIAESQTSASCA